MEDIPTPNPRHIRIADLREEDRPREKLLKHGVKTLTSSELLAILIGNGTRNISALDLAKNLLQHADNKLSTLLTYTVPQFQKHKGIGQAKAVTLMAALELGHRLTEEKHEPLVTITCASDLAQLMKPHLMGLLHEEMWVIFLNRALHVIGKKRHSSGGSKSTVIDVKMIVRDALEYQADAIALAHNHPSGSIQASKQDIDSTHNLLNALHFFEIRLIDHIIIGKNQYASFMHQVPPPLIMPQ